MDWTKSYSSTWRVFRVNRKTWADDEKLSNVINVDVTRTANGELIESGSMEVTGDCEPGYYRIVLTAEQGGEVIRVDVATLLFNITDGEFNYGINTDSLEGFSVLYPAFTTSVITGEYAPAGSDGAQYAGNLLAGAINAPVEVEGSFILNEHIVHELGSSVLSAVWSVLNAGNFVIQIDGRGVVHIKPKPTEASFVIDNSLLGLLENGIKYERDISEIPNRYIIIDGINITIAENDDEESIVSFPSRGYYVDVIDTSPTPVNGETYAEYANRMLKEQSVLSEEKEYTREFAPDVYPYSLIKATINGLDGNMRVKSQTIMCGNGISVSEKSAKEVQLYE